jgi:ubiquinone biosynthesis monooxygenase Coq6
MYRSLIRRLATTSKPNLQDVVVIGGGPAGLSLLAALKSSHKTRHLKCTLIEAGSLEPIRAFGEDAPEEYTNRVVSLTPKSVEFMQERIGNWEFINQDRVKFYDSVVAYDGKDSEARIQLDAASATHSGGSLAVMCENINIQSSLLQRLEELNCRDTTILDNTKVVEITSPIPVDLENHSLSAPPATSQLDWPIVKLSNGESIQTRLLVGADGYNSPVRTFAGIESRGWMYNRFGVVATVKLQYEDFRSIGWQRFLSTGPLAILPLTEENATIVWSSPPELSELLVKVSPEIFPSLVNAAMTLEEVDLKYIYKVLKNDPEDMSVLEDIEWRMSKIKLSELETKYPLPLVEVVEGSRARFPLRFSHADTYVSERIALVGDAAHTVHPLAGQGLNMGQSDVAALVEALELGVERGMDIGSLLVLDKYVATAWPSNHVIMGVCDKLHKIFSFEAWPVVALRGWGIKSLNSLGFIKDMMVGNISGR